MSLTMISDLIAELATRLAEVPLPYGSDPQAVTEELAASSRPREPRSLALPQW